MNRVVDIVSAVASGRRTAAAELADCAARHAATHPAINALVQPRFAEAQVEAEAIPAGAPLAGVPVSVKECFPVRGLVTTLGIPARRRAIDEADADLVVRLKAAGAIVVGKANVPQAMYLHETDNPVWGRSSHPTYPDRNPGGSSGGDAALVAAGVVPLGVGTDLAGSIRQPAHACGIVGIMPRSATLGDGGSFDTMPHLRVVRPRAGFLAATIGDAAHALEALGVIATETPSPAAYRPLHIGWWDDCGPLEPSPAIRRAVHEAVGRLARSGAATTQLSGALADEAAWLHLAILSADGGADVRSLFSGSRPIPDVARLLRLARLPRMLRPALSAMARLGGRAIEARAVAATGPRNEAGFAALLAARDAVAAQARDLARDYDVIVCPVSALPALRHGTGAQLLIAAAPCLLANLLDLPAGAVPVSHVRPDEETGRSNSLDPVARLAAATDRGSAGLPVGVQVIGLDTTPKVGEGLVLKVMQAIEQV